MQPFLLLSIAAKDLLLVIVINLDIQMFIVTILSQ